MYIVAKWLNKTTNTNIHQMRTNTRTRSLGHWVNESHRQKIKMANGNNIENKFYPTLW